MSHDSMKGKKGISTSTDNTFNNCYNVGNNGTEIICYLPQIMEPDKSVFERLGFTFKNIGDTVLCEATLPKGWTIVTSTNYWKYFFDENGFKRGSSYYKTGYHYKCGFTYREGFMKLYTKFYISSLPDNLKDYKGPFTVTVKDSNDNIVFTAGQSEKEFTLEHKALMRKAEQYLKENYPLWEDPTQYWD